MLVEKWDDAHNFPRFTRDNHEAERSEAVHDDDADACARGAGSSRSRITKRRGASSARNLDVNIGNLPKYHGTATFTGGTVAIQNYVPMWANMKAPFVIDGPRIHLDRIDLDTDGATTVARGDVDIGALAGADLPGASRACSFRACASCSSRTRRGRWPATATSPASFQLFKDGRGTAI